MADLKNTKTPFDLAPDEKSSMDELLKSLEGQDIESFNMGSIITAKVIHSDNESVYLDIGKKQEGRCLRSEFTDAPEPGIDIQVLIQNSSQDGVVILSYAEAEKRRAWQKIGEAYEAGIQLSGKIDRTVSHGFIVKVDGVELFMPMSQSDLKAGPRTRFPKGKEIDVKILELKERYHSAIVSHRAVIEERNDVSWNDFLAKYSVGDVVEGKIMKTVSFGVFVQLDGIVGLLHQSDMSWKKHLKFKNRFKIDETIQVKILGMDRDNNRVSLGIKQLTEDPWEWASKEIGEGDIVKGKVVSITDYGAFIELCEGLEGLVHVTELSWAKRSLHPKKYLEKGQEVEAKVLSIDSKAKRLSLGLRQLQEDPWDSLLKKHKAGDVLEGKIMSVTKFGTFVEIMKDIEGLIHFNDYSWDSNFDRKSLKKGDIIKFKILDIHPGERRISCGIKQLTPSPYELLKQKYKTGASLECKVKNITDFGMFVELEKGFEGMIHISNIPLEQNQTIKDLFKPGDTVTAVLQKIDVNTQKISLSIKAFEKKQEREMYSQYLKKDDAPSTSSLGAFLKSAGIKGSAASDSNGKE